MGMDEPFRKGQLNKAIPAIKLVNAYFANILALAVWTAEHRKGTSRSVGIYDDGILSYRRRAARFNDFFAVLQVRKESIR